MYPTNKSQSSSHDMLVTFAQLAGIGLITFFILLALALVLPGAV